jgi:AcrR family transcriptional regulator
MSARQEELLERAYEYVLDHGISNLSLRPLAQAIGSSPRVLLFLFGSKHGLIRALLARGRAEQTALARQVAHQRPDAGLADLTTAIWDWVAAPRHRPLAILWLESYARSLAEPDGPWAGFAEQTVADWLTILADAQPAARRRTKAGAAQRTVALSVLRGALLDLLATGDVDRTTAAVRVALGQVSSPPRWPGSSSP